MERVYVGRHRIRSQSGHVRFYDTRRWIVRGLSRLQIARVTDGADRARAYASPRHAAPIDATELLIEADAIVSASV
jgi:hypothetical protein